MQKRNIGMTSLEAAALYSSNGATSDVEEANLLAEGKILDPDKLQRAFFRRALGFDFSVITDEKHGKYIIRDDERGGSVTCAIVDDYNNQAAKLAKAIIKLKKLHEQAVIDA